MEERLLDEGLYNDWLREVKELTAYLAFVETPPTFNPRAFHFKRRRQMCITVVKRKKRRRPRHYKRVSQ
jgi:hypothetical protein